MRLALGLGLPYGGEAGVGVPGGSPASKALIDETDGLALSFVDDYFLSSTGHYGSARVKDTSTPANNYNSHPFGLLTYAGASKKWVRGPSGLLIESDPALTLPYEWDENGDLLGIRVEEQRTNLTLWSEDFSASYWSDSQNVSITPNQGIAPDGESPAALVEVLDEGGAPRVSVLGSLVVDEHNTVSWFVKSVVGDILGLMIRTNQVVFDLSGGGSVVSGSGAGIQKWLDGWFRIWLTATPSSQSRYGLVFTGSSVGDKFLIWGADHEHGDSVTSYIRTAGSTVTRAADVIGPALDKFPWNEGNGVLTVNDEEVEPSDNGTLLTLAAPEGDTHIRTVKWIPSS